MAENANAQNSTAPLAEVLKAVEKHVASCRSSEPDREAKTVKDWRRTFDQDSSAMNKAIFNDSSDQDVYQATLQTISSLVEILSRTKQKL